MPVTDLFSKRQKLARGEVPEVYSYDALAGPLRAQMVHILRDLTFPKAGHDHIAKMFWRDIHETLAREYGVFALAPSGAPPYPDFQQAWFDFVMGEKNVEHALDILELTFSRFPSFRYRTYLQGQLAAAIAEVNTRFQEQGVGYQFAAGHLMRIDSQFTHAEIVRPALSLLADASFTGVNQEFLRAHEHYRENRFKECLVECLKALESTIKVIATTKGWSFASGDTAKRLIDLVFERELIPTALQSEFAALRSSLESGVPAIRNRMAGHGQGTQLIEVPSYLAGYLLNLTAASIVLLVSAARSTNADAA